MAERIMAERILAEHIMIVSHCQIVKGTSDCVNDRRLGWPDCRGYWHWYWTGE
jgi:hypothetical protein